MTILVAVSWIPPVTLFGKWRGIVLLAEGVGVKPKPLLPFRHSVLVTH